MGVASWKGQRVLAFISRSALKETAEGSPEAGVRERNCIRRGGECIQI